MKNLGTKSLIIVLGIISLSLVGVIVFGGYYIKDKSIKTNEIVQKVEEGNSTSIIVQSINSSGPNSKNELSKLNDLGLSQDKLINFIESLEGLAQSMNLTIKIISVESEPGKGADNPDKIHFRIETSGRWGSNMQFLHALEYLPYRTMINNAALSSKGDIVVNQGTSTVSQKNSWTLNTEVAVYSFK
jgi:hypothetical protein